MRGKCRLIELEGAHWICLRIRGAHEKEAVTYDRLVPYSDVEFRLVLHCLSEVWDLPDLSQD